MRSKLMAIHAKKRTYHLKNPAFKFLCPLCGVARAFAHSSHMSAKNFLQLATAALCFVMLAYPYWGMRSLLCIFFFWAIQETTIKLSHRRHIPCPDCGFDAVWYKRDVKKAKQLVQKFWEQTSAAPLRSEKS
jgi:predicted RNA-binding Zn-ribbon protein involved in translation (DUF1610 family)